MVGTQKSESIIHMYMSVLRGQTRTDRNGGYTKIRVCIKRPDSSRSKWWVQKSESIINVCIKRPDSSRSKWWVHKSESIIHVFIKRPDSNRSKWWIHKNQNL
jgi:hypothetical protein